MDGAGAVLAGGGRRPGRAAWWRSATRSRGRAIVHRAVPVRRRQPWQGDPAPDRRQFVPSLDQRRARRRGRADRRSHPGRAGGPRPGPVGCSGLTSGTDHRVRHRSRSERSGSGAGGLRAHQLSRRGRGGDAALGERLPALSGPATRARRLLSRRSRHRIDGGGGRAGRAVRSGALRGRRARGNCRGRGGLWAEPDHSVPGLLRASRL